MNAQSLSIYMCFSRKKPVNLHVYIYVAVARHLCNGLLGTPLLPSYTLTVSQGMSQQ